MVRPRKPTAMKVLNGTAQPSRLNQNEPRPPEGDLDCPEHLTGEARNEWNRMAPSLAAIGCFKNVDRAALELYCTSYENWFIAYNFLEEKKRKFGTGEIRDEGSSALTYKQFNRSGSTIRVRPEVRICSDERAAMLRFLTEFGLTPASRSKVVATPPSKPGENSKYERPA